jgi:hypothetical protein
MKLNVIFTGLMITMFFGLFPFILNQIGLKLELGIIINALTIGIIFILLN